jgi:hypothetical protein
VENSIKEWRWFIKESAPGCRFRDRYRRRQQLGRDRSMLRRASYVAIGIALALVSLLLAPLPGPGWGTFFVGSGIVAGEVLLVARLLDRGEVKLREVLQRIKGVERVGCCGEGVGSPNDLPLLRSIDLRSPSNVLSCALSPLAIPVEPSCVSSLCLGRLSCKPGG